MIALIAVVCIAAVTQLGDAASDKFDTAGSAIGDTATESEATPACTGGTVYYSPDSGTYTEWGSGGFSACAPGAPFLPPGGVPAGCTGPLVMYTSDGQWIYDRSPGNFILTIC